PDHDRTADHGARIVWAAIRSWSGLPRGRRLSRLAHDLPLVELRPDVVHTEFVTQAIGRGHLPGLLDRPLTTSIRGFDVSHAGLDRPGYLDDVWPTLTAVHVLGEDLRARAAARGCPPGMPTTVIPPALEAADLPRAPAAAAIGPDRPLRLLSVGRLHWKKAHHHTLAALRRVLDDGVPARLTIVGDGDEFESLAFARHQLDLDDEVDLVGALPREEARARLATADLFVHSAVSEGFSNAVLEAQGAGLPVVCSDAEGLAENVADGRTGLVVPRRDPAAMAEAIVTLARDPRRRSRLGTAGRERAASFALDRQADAFVRFFEEAVALGPARPGARS
ncbi:MAG: glycosyltransferase family 4 protein, partial [Actinomycetota bacterium]